MEEKRNFFKYENEEWVKVNFEDIKENDILVASFETKPELIGRYYLAKEKPEFNDEFKKLAFKCDMELEAPEGVKPFDWSKK